MLGVIIAIISGTLMSVQGVFNTNLNKQTNLWFSNMYIQITAFVMCLVMWLVTKSGGNLGQLFKVKNKYVLLGGIIGAFITMTVIESISRLGTAQAIMIIIIAQMIAAYIIEVFGLFGSEKAEFQWRRLFAVLIVIGGIILFKRE